MGNPAGVKRDFDALERRRFKAFALLSKGVSEAEIARQVGAHRQSVNRWAKAIEEQGREGLRQAGRAGRKSRLSEAELKRLEERLKRGAEVAGYETHLWSPGRGGGLVGREFWGKYQGGARRWVFKKTRWGWPPAPGKSLGGREGGL